MIIKKSPEEIERMAAAGAILVRTMNLLQGKIRPGVTTKDLDDAAERFIRSQGATPAFKGYRGFPGSICASPNSMIVHGIPSLQAQAPRPPLGRHRRHPRRLGRRRGADVPGRPGQPGCAEAAAVTEESLMVAVPAVRAGNHLGDIGHAIQTHVEAEGLSIVRSLVGHGIGGEMHEDPSCQLRRGRYGRRGGGGDGARDRADGDRRPACGPRRRRPVVDLLPGRLAGRPLEFTIAVTSDGPAS